jgi:hypothetical protein
MSEGQGIRRIRNAVHRHQPAFGASTVSYVAAALPAPSAFKTGTQGGGTLQGALPLIP